MIGLDSCGLEDSMTQRQELAIVRHHEAKVMDGDRIIADARQVKRMFECVHGRLLHPWHTHCIYLRFVYLWQILVDIPTLDAESLRQGWCERFPRKPATTMALASMLPDWNPRIESLSMKFMHSKVKAASSKNFLVSQAHEMDDEHACLQFGKVKTGLFNLSYKAPVAAIQAFGVALSLYNWQGQSAKGKKKKKKRR